MNFEVRRVYSTEAARTFRAFMEQLIPSEKPFGTEVWLHPHVECYLVFIDTEKAGMIVFQSDAGVAATFEQKELPSVPGQIYLLFGGLLEKWRGRDFGTLALNWLIAIAKDRKNTDRIVSNIRPSNTAAERLHRSMGFVKGHLIEGYYKDLPEDTQVMVLELANV